MGINRVSNPAKLRRLSRLVGVPIIRAYARCFNDQNEVLAFTAECEGWVVRLKKGTFERYDEGHYRLVACEEFGGYKLMRSA